MQMLYILLIVLAAVNEYNPIEHTHSADKVPEGLDAWHQGGIIDADAPTVRWQPRLVSAFKNPSVNAKCAPGEKQGQLDN